MTDVVVVGEPRDGRRGDSSSGLAFAIWLPPPPPRDGGGAGMGNGGTVPRKTSGGTDSSSVNTRGVSDCNTFPGSLTSTEILTSGTSGSSGVPLPVVVATPAPFFRSVNGFFPCTIAWRSWLELKAGKVRPPTAAGDERGLTFFPPGDEEEAFGLSLRCDEGGSLWVPAEGRAAVAAPASGRAVVRYVEADTRRIRNLRRSSPSFSRSRLASAAVTDGDDDEEEEK